MKLLGAIFIILATSVFGWEISGRLARRTKQIRYLITAFEALEAEMVFGMTPLSLACEQVSRRHDPPISLLFHDVASRLHKEERPAPDIWKTSLKKWQRKTDLDKPELKILEQFGQTLGQQDLENQRKQIRLAVSYLDKEEKHAFERQNKFSSMYKSLGFLGGVLLVLIML
ncbi:stage III sporulation protein AB [Evansella caseinilytica]|uniref:Stage III sporulation protein AB n=1 Tax=Evansella caseinilytica TaxID=1503961 RepID=A0A1H3KVT3_9BACI|nr:stage III sporulation protein SpoIIIAB [Evansella caseinilytica]SDY56099.1 stage III sporulation protein AB [Evansella caseinilytica]